jgi:CRP-like cAMP-binding protein
MEGLPIEVIKFLNPENLPQQLKSKISYQDLEAGQALFHQGDKALAIYALESGRLRLERYTLDGKPVTFQIVRQGESFAVMALYDDVYQCNAISELPSRVIVYPKQAILDTLSSQPELAEELMMQLIRDIQVLKLRLELREIRAAQDRTLHYLQSIAKFGGNTVNFERPLKMVAQDLGLSPEVFYRTLADLEKQGTISRVKRQVTLNNHFAA